MKMVLKQSGYPSCLVASYREASEIFGGRRNDSGKGYRTFPAAYVYLDDACVARISYNGRVWSHEHISDERLIYDPYDRKQRSGHTTDARLIAHGAVYGSDPSVLSDTHSEHSS